MRLANILRKDGARTLAIGGPNGELTDVERLSVDGVTNIRAALEQGPAYLDKLRKAAATAPAAAVLGADEVAAWLPVAEADSKIFCVGLNYVSHAEELGVAIPKQPSIFSRYGTTCVGHEGDILLPKSSDAVDWEGELAVVIGVPTKYVTEDEALSRIAGASCLNDVSMRDFQERLPRITLAKNFDGSAPMGPWLVTLDEAGDLEKLDVETRVNGEVVQKASTSEFIFSIPFLVSLVSQVCELRPGDVISTGTPGGVGWARKPQWYLKDGDVVELEITSLGTLRNTARKEAV